MARGATKTSEQMAQGTYGQAQGAANTAGSQANQAYGTLMPQIAQMLTPGGNPAVTAATMGALGSEFGNARQGVLNTAARTGNNASTNAALDKLALQEGSVGAQTAANNVAKQQQEAQQLLAQIYGGASRNQTADINAMTGANNAYSNAIKTGGGVWQPILQYLSNGMKAAGSIAAAG